MLYFICYWIISFWEYHKQQWLVFPSYAKMYLHIDNTFVINGVIIASGIGIAIGSIIY